MSTIESLISQLERAASTADLTLRYKLSGQLQRLARAIATPRQTMQHFGYTYTEQVIAKAAADLGLFEILSQSEGPLKTDEVASKSGADPALIGLATEVSLLAFILMFTRPHPEASRFDILRRRSRGVKLRCERYHAPTSFTSGQGKHHVWF